MKIVVKEAKSEAVPAPEYSLEDWMDEWKNGDAAIFLCGEPPRGSYAPEFAEFPCALDINGKWIPRTYYDAKEDPKILGSVLVGEQEWLDSIAGNFRHPKAEYTIYNTQKVPEYALREIGKAIEQTIGFEEYYEKINQLQKQLKQAKRNAPRATWF